MALWVYEERIEDLAKFLEAKGCTVNTERAGYRVLMFNKDNTQHTQGYGNDAGIYIKFTGPEVKMVSDFIKELENGKKQI